MIGKLITPQEGEVSPLLLQLVVPFEEIVPVAAKEWLGKVTTSHGTSREMLLVSALTSTSTLIGKSTLQVFLNLWRKGEPFYSCNVHDSKNARFFLQYNRCQLS